MINVLFRAVGLTGLLVGSYTSMLHAVDFPDAGVHWRSPEPNSLGKMVYAIGSTVPMQASIVDLALVSEVRFKVDGQVVGSDDTPPFTYNWAAAGNGTVVMTAEAIAGETTLATSDRSIEVVGDGLRITPSQVVITLPPDGSGTVSINLENLGPQAREWAVQRWGGTTTVGQPSVDSSIQLSSGIDNSSPVKIRGLSTPSELDDELWYTTNGSTYNRIRLHDQADLPAFSGTRSVDYEWGFTFNSVDDNIWHKGYYNQGGQTKYAWFEIDPDADEIISQVESLGNDRVERNGGLRYLTHAPGVFYEFHHEWDGVYHTDQFALVQSREQDGMMLSFDLPPSLTPFDLKFQTGDAYFHNLITAHGNLWIADNEAFANKSIGLIRWQPGMTDIEELPTIASTDIPGWGGNLFSQSSQIVGASQDGFVWVYVQHNKKPRIYRVDTGLRSWISLDSQAGELANGAETSVGLSIDTTGMSPGSYEATLLFTQYPEDNLPQISMPVTLTISATGSRTIVVGSNVAETVFWNINPTAASEEQDGNEATFRGLHESNDHVATPQAGGIN